MYKDFLKKYGISTKLLSQNSKMKKSGTAEIAVYNWTLPAFRAKDGTKTCPNAGVCAIGCYAKQGAYVWDNVSQRHHKNLDASKDVDFADAMIHEISLVYKRTLKQDKDLYIRVHDSGDFYSLDYTMSWFRVFNAFAGSPKIKFYAYTKQVEMFQDLKKFYADTFPKKFEVIYSYGGKQDSRIDNDTERHALVFETEVELAAKGYVDASSDDILALGENHRIGLVYHGTKGYGKTAWNKVKS